MEEEGMADRLEESVYVPIYKKGDKKECGNY